MGSGLSVARLGGWLLVSIIAASCGGGATAPPPPPPPPPAPGPPSTISKQAGDNQVANAGDAVAVAPAVKVVDAAARAVPNAVVTFAVVAGAGTVTGATPTTDANGVATVGSWVLGAVGPNTLSATVAGTGVNPATFTATGTAPPFHPTGNVTLTGSHSYTDVLIPAGVTVTATGDLTLTVQGDFQMAGTMTGNCTTITVNAGGLLTLGGPITNDCLVAPAGAFPGVRLFGKGGYTVTGTGGVRSSGGVEITNDTTLTDASFPAAPAGTPAARVARPAAAAVGPPCTFVAGAFPAPSIPGRNGAPGIAGTPGRPAPPLVATCQGDLWVTGPLFIASSPGGNGGDGTATGAVPTARGGNGAKGGDLTLRATGDLVITPQAMAVQLSTGKGGDGGNATATGQGPGVGPATATGGQGGPPGLTSLIALGNLVIGATLNLHIGDGGAGGDAIGRGVDPTNPGGCNRGPPGGNGQATGGIGGTTPNLRLMGANVTGGVFVVLTGGTGGSGGAATATGGRGADGIALCPDGGDGGFANATGGDGGAAQLKDLLGQPFGNGGRGGQVIWRGARGGDGFGDACQPPSVLAGGKGGIGGLFIQGKPGTGGSGRVPGVNGAVTLVGVANGGDGGNGHPLGVKGIGGGNLTPVGGQLSFQDGIDGWQCDHYTITIALAPGTSDVDDVEGVLHVTPTTDIVWVHQVLGMAQFTQAEVRGFPVHLLRANGGPDGLGNFFVNGVFHATIKGIDQVGDLVFKGRVLGPLLTGPNANTPYFTVDIDPLGTASFRAAHYRGLGSLKVP